jgi:hypothetical protein
MLEWYPEAKDWWYIRFSDETYFGFGPQGKVNVCRRLWERMCLSCTISKPSLEEKDIKRLYAWAAVGYNFKSELVWYNVPSNNNRKITIKIYRNKILEPIIGEWLRQGHNFVLEEDNDSGHGTSKDNIIKTWKQENGLTSYFNCSNSPDFVPIERAWIAPKQYVKRDLAGMMKLSKSWPRKAGPP